MPASRMGRPRIVVTGSNGQLAREIRLLAVEQDAFEFIFLSKEELPIHDFSGTANFFKATKPQFCINCAAYTAVDKAEAEPEAAFLINGEAAGAVASACYASGARFIQVSTDYVFNGKRADPYRENDPVDPLNVYGASKLMGEEKALQFNPESIIVRTSWVYSSFGSNFVKTMVRLLREKDRITVVNDQFGSPTYAADLARTLLTIVNCGKWVPGIFHYSNKGLLSWYQFACAIREIQGSACEIIPVSSADYVTVARRPAYSVLDNTKIKSTYPVEIKEWKASLETCLRKLRAEA